MKKYPNISVIKRFVSEIKSDDIKNINIYKYKYYYINIKRVRMLKKLIRETGGSTPYYCRKALVQSNYNYNKAKELMETNFQLLIKK